MNPWALVILGIGILLIIMGVKGSYGGVIGALTGKPYSGGTGGSSSGSKSKPLKPIIPPGTGIIPGNRGTPNPAGIVAR